MLLWPCSSSVKQLYWVGVGLSDRVLAEHAQSPGFHPQLCLKKFSLKATCTDADCIELYPSKAGAGLASADVFDHVSLSLACKAVTAIIPTMCHLAQVTGISEKGTQTG
jgi:hypothetical protein